MTAQDESKFVKARRKVIASRFRALNEMQLEGVLTTQGPLLLLAGAGSGKTTVLINRIENLIRFGAAADSAAVPETVTAADVQFLCRYAEHPDPEDDARADALCAYDPAPAWSIIAITFTNKAANELRERLADKLGRGADDVWAMTFHSACCRILRQNIDLMGYDRRFTIYDTADSERVMKEVIRDMGLDEKTFPAKAVLRQISAAKDKLLTPEAFTADAKSSTDFRLERVGRAYAEYQRRLKDASALDFDDIILLTVRLLQEYDEVRDRYQRKFHYVLIDEYQDTNNLQYLLATLLSGRYENICVVGDDDQSIYRFRGATIANILNFEKQYQGARTIRLEQNYRSTKYILQAANTVISNNKGRKGKNLWTANNQGEKLTVYEAFNETDEGNFVASKILAGVSAGMPFQSNAILYRTNAQSNAIEKSLQRNGIPYRIIGGTRFFDRAEVKDMLAYLCVINNPADDLRLRRIINTPARGIGAKTVESAERQAAAAGRPVFSVLEDAGDYPSLEKARAKVAAFVQLIAGCTALLETMELPDFYDEVLARTGYLTVLEAKNDVESQTRAENVRELKSSIIGYVEGAETPTLAGFLEEVSLYTDIEQYDAGADAAVMMTMHSAKGLEFPQVFLVGMEEGLFPGNRVLTEPDELEEERRLCYVAITRAKQHLYLTHARQRMIYGRTSFNQPSRFLAEIPQTCIEQLERHRERGVGTSYEATTRRASYDFEKNTGNRGIQRSDTKRPPASSVKTAPMLELSKGDQVTHTAFGEGMVLTVLPMGGDALWEIAFDKVGTKKLMAKTASAHTKKKGG